MCTIYYVVWEIFCNTLLNSIFIILYRLSCVVGTLLIYIWLMVRLLFCRASHVLISSCLQFPLFNILYANFTVYDFVSSSFLLHSSSLVSKWIIIPIHLFQGKLYLTNFLFGQPTNSPNIPPPP